MWNFLQWLMTPHDLPNIVKDRIQYLEWRALQARVRVQREQYRILAIQAEADYLQRWLKAEADSHTPPAG